MPSTPDWYPASMDALMAWWVVFFDQLKNHGFATKYGIDGTVMTKVETISDWFNYWVPLRHSEDAFSQALTKYFNTIAGTDPNAEPPSPPTFAPGGSPPAEVEPGVEEFVRALARSIKNSTIYAPADGEAMGIQTPVSAGIAPEDMKPSIKLTTREAFGVGVTFKRAGMSAIRLEYRHKGGGSWLPAGVLLTSPGAFTVAPQTPGEPEQIEVRAVYMQGNNNVGQWSSIEVAFVGP